MVTVIEAELLLKPNSLTQKWKKSLLTIMRYTITRLFCQIYEN